MKLRDWLATRTANALRRAANDIAGRGLVDAEHRAAALLSNTTWALRNTTTGRVIRLDLATDPLATLPRVSLAALDRRQLAATLVVGMAETAGHEADDLLAAGDDVGHAVLLALSIELVDAAEELTRG